VGRVYFRRIDGHRRSGSSASLAEWDALQVINVPRTREELEQAVTDAKSCLDSLAPVTDTAEDPADLRRIGLALRD
jgi:hypothetical protein